MLSFCVVVVAFVAVVVAVVIDYGCCGCCFYGPIPLFCVLDLGVYSFCDLTDCD